MKKIPKCKKSKKKPPEALLAATFGLKIEKRGSTPAFPRQFHAKWAPMGPNGPPWAPMGPKWGPILVQKVISPTDKSNFNEKI